MRKPKSGTQTPVEKQPERELREKVTLENGATYEGEWIGK